MITMQGDYLIPDLTVPESPTLGKYGMLRRTFLREHRDGIYTGMLLKGTLNSHLSQVDRQANEMMEHADKFRDDLEEMSDQFLADINTPFFFDAENDYESDFDYAEFTAENLLKIHEDILSIEADREAERATNEYEAEFGADGTIQFHPGEELDELPISTVEDGRVVTYPNAEALLDAQENATDLTPPPTVKRPQRVTLHMIHPEISTEYRTDFKIENDSIGVGTPLERFYHNIQAIQLLNKLENEGKLATPTEQRVLADYVGWGGLSEFFKEDNPHYAELKNVLSESEYESARESTLTAFYDEPYRKERGRNI